MKATVCKILDFPAAHRNTRHDGHCNRIHGHTWTVEIYVKGTVIEDPESPHYGMVIDFKEIKRVYEEAIEPFVEHQYLNETLSILEEFTTEYIAGWIYKQLKAQIQGVCKVRLWEGKSSFVEIVNGDLL